VPERELLIRLKAEGGAQVTEVVGQSREEVDELDSATKRSSKSLTEHAKSSGMFTRALKSAAGFAGVAGFAFGLKDVVEKALTLQTTTAAMGKAISNVGLPVRATTKAFKDYADATSVKGGFASAEQLATLRRSPRRPARRLRRCS